MAYIGHHPSEFQLEEIFRSLPGNSAKMDFHQFRRVMDNFTASESLYDEMKEAFKLFDKNSNGFVSPEELYETLNDMGDKMHLEDAQQLVQVADIDGDGKLNFEEASQPRGTACHNMRMRGDE